MGASFAPDSVTFNGCILSSVYVCNIRSSKNGVIFFLCLIKHKHELNSYLSALTSNGHLSSHGSASLIKADRCFPLAPNQANHKQNSLANIFPFQIAAITIQHKVYLVPAVCVFVFLLLSVCAASSASVDEGGPYCLRHRGSWKSMFDLPAT